MQRSASRRNFGFTLVELLFIVGVIAVLAMVFWPVFVRSRKPQPPSCYNNVRQIVLGFKQYLNDFNEHYPLVYVTNSPGPTPPHGWADAIQPYVRNTQVYQCPSDTNAGSAIPGTRNYTDFWYNANFIVRRKAKSGTFYWTGANESMLGSSAQTIIAGDGGNTTGTPTGTATYNQCGDGSTLTGRNQTCVAAPNGNATLPISDLHYDGVVFAFADGHVKWYRSTNPTQIQQVINNGATQKSIGGNVTFSLLDR